MIEDAAIVIPNFNSSKFLPILFKMIDGLLGRIEIFVIDDCSDDGCLPIYGKKYLDKINIIRNEKNRGPQYIRNYALKNIKKKYLLFIDTDIRISPEMVFLLLEHRREADVVFPQINYFSGQRLTPVNDFEKERCTNSAVFIINRERVEKSGQYFDNDIYMNLEDNEFFSRLWAFKFSFKYIKEVIALHPEKKYYPEKQYYHKVKNSIIFFTKHAGIIPFRINAFLWIFFYTGLHFVAAILNRSFTLASGGFEKVRFSRRPGFFYPRIVLLYLFFKAILWNIFHLKFLFAKRKILKIELKDQGFLNKTI